MRNKILILLFALTCADFLDLVLPKTCPDEDIAAKCESQCELTYVDCLLACSETNCLIECGRSLTDCVNDCPCNVNCPDGCNDCSNPICACGKNPSPQNEDNLQECMKEKCIDLGKCIIDCKNDQPCEESCVTLFKEQYDQCPCQNDCPFGCPCNSFDCQPDKKSVLVLNTAYPSNKPVLIKFDGGVEENLDFTMGPNTSVFSSCSAKLNGELFVFGGYGNSNEKQISKIVDCSLKRVGELPNAFTSGACGTFLFADDERVMFCFPYSDMKKCFSYDGEQYTNHPSSVNDHCLTTLGDIENKILAVGHFYSTTSTGNTKVELFDINSNKWTTKTSFPYCSSRIFDYGVISRKSSVLIIGGVCDINSFSSLIAKYTIDNWERVGNQIKIQEHDIEQLQMKIEFMSSVDQEHCKAFHIKPTLIIYSLSKTEIWSLDENDNTVNMKIAEPTLNNYCDHPELFIVDSDFCTKK